MSVLVPLFVLCLLPVFVCILLQFNKLVAFEQAHCSDEWQSDGCPNGFRLGVGSGDTATTACAFVWLFLTPDWARQHAQAGTYLHAYRAGALVWNLSIVAFVLWLRHAR